MVRQPGLTKGQLEAGMGRSIPIASKVLLQKSRNGPGSRMLNVINATDNKCYCVPKALAHEFSVRWDTMLNERDVSMVTVNFDSLAAQFVMQWIKGGGKDSTGEGSVLYPIDSSAKMQNIRSFASFLGTHDLVSRVDIDIERLKQNTKASEEVKAAQLKNAAAGKDRVGKRRCHRCGDPRHIRAKCPLMGCRVPGGSWRYTPPGMVLLSSTDKINGDAKAGEMKRPNKGNAKDRVPQVDTKTKLKPEYLQHTAGNIATFYLCDKAGTEWVLPWSRTKLNFQTIPGSGRVRIFGEAPLEFAWIPRIDSAIKEVKVTSDKPKADLP